MFPCSRFHATRNLRRHRTQLPKKPQIVAWNSIICTLCTHLTTWPHFRSQILFNFGACISKHSRQIVFNKRGLQNFDQIPYKTEVFFPAMQLASVRIVGCLLNLRVFTCECYKNPFNKILSGMQNTRLKSWVGRICNNALLQKFCCFRN